MHWSCSPSFFSRAQQCEPDSSHPVFFLAFHIQFYKIFGNWFLIGDSDHFDTDPDPAFRHWRIQESWSLRKFTFSAYRTYFHVLGFEEGWPSHSRTRRQPIARSRHDDGLRSYWPERSSQRLAQQGKPIESQLDNQGNDHFYFYSRLTCIFFPFFEEK